MKELFVLHESWNVLASLVNRMLNTILITILNLDEKREISGHQYTLKNGIKVRFIFLIGSYHVGHFIIDTLNKGRSCRESKFLFVSRLFMIHITY